MISEITCVVRGPIELESGSTLHVDYDDGLAFSTIFESDRAIRVEAGQAIRLTCAIRTDCRLHFDGEPVLELRSYEIHDA